MSEFPPNCVRFVIYRGVRTTINGNIRTFTDSIRGKLCEFCMRRSNLCGSKAKMCETHAKCVRVDRSVSDSLTFCSPEYICTRAWIISKWRINRVVIHKHMINDLSPQQCSSDWPCSKVQWHFAHFSEIFNGLATGNPELWCSSSLSEKHTKNVFSFNFLKWTL